MLLMVHVLLEWVMLEFFFIHILLALMIIIPIYRTNIEIIPMNWLILLCN